MMDFDTLLKELVTTFDDDHVKMAMARIMLSGKPETRVRDMMHSHLFETDGVRSFSEWSGEVGGQKIKLVDLAIHSHHNGVPTALRGLIEFKAWMGIDVFDAIRWEPNPSPARLGHSIIGQFAKDAAKLRQARVVDNEAPWLAICTLLYYVRPCQGRQDLIPHLKYSGIVRQDYQHPRSMDEMCNTFVANLKRLTATLNPPVTIHTPTILMSVEDVLGHDVALAAIWCKV
jgi:hypothetical protein